MRRNYPGDKRRREEENRKYQAAKRLKKLNKSKNTVETGTEQAPATAAVEGNASGENTES